MRQFGDGGDESARVPPAECNGSFQASDEHSNDYAQSIGEKRRHTDDYDADDDDDCCRPVSTVKRCSPAMNSRNLSAEVEQNWDRDDCRGTIQRPTENARLCEQFLIEFDGSMDRRPANYMEHLIWEAKWMLYSGERLFDGMLALCNSVPGLFDSSESLFLIKFAWELTRSWSSARFQQGPEWGQLVTVFAFAGMLRRKNPQAHCQVLAMLTYFMAHFGEKLLNHRGGWDDFVNYCVQSPGCNPRRNVGGLE